MSKASDFAKITPALSKDVQGVEYAYVSRMGTLHLSRAITLDPKEALLFADWIYDTFGPTEPKGD